MTRNIPRHFVVTVRKSSWHSLPIREEKPLEWMLGHEYSNEDRDSRCVNCTRLLSSMVTRSVSPIIHGTLYLCCKCNIFTLSFIYRRIYSNSWPRFLHAVTPIRFQVFQYPSERDNGTLFFFHRLWTISRRVISLYQYYAPRVSREVRAYHAEFFFGR